MKARILLCFVLSLSTFAAAQKLQGTVTNGTTGKPASNAEVTLISLAGGMNEAGRTKTDGAGRFTLDLAGDAGMPHLVRVSHQNVSYFKIAPPGTNTADVQIYDVASKLEGIATAVRIMRLQSAGSDLQVMELYAVRNQSVPARTLGGDRTFEIALSEGATLDTASARSPNGQPLTTMPLPVDGKKGQYYFSFPLRPGETQFEVAYRLPYSGQATIRPVLLNDTQHFVAMLPKTMQFAPQGKTQFASMPDETGANVQVVTNAKAGAPVAFSISGTGTLADESAGSPAQQQEGNSGMGGGPAMGGGPGGGIGNPIGSPDPLSKYRWPLLAVLTAILAIGGVYIARRGPATQNAESFASSVPSVPDTSDVAQPAEPRSARLLDVMKEELFQLEVEHQQGRISDEEYAKAKAALDHTLKRALTRAS